MIAFNLDVEQTLDLTHSALQCLLLATATAVLVVAAVFLDAARAELRRWGRAGRRGGAAS